MNKRRSFFVLLGTVLVLFILVGRLFWIQVIARRAFTNSGIDLVANSVAQRERGLILDDGRGSIVDRNYVPITGEKSLGLAAFPIRPKLAADHYPAAQIAGILGVNRAKWDAFQQGLKVPTFWQDADSKSPIALTEEQVRKLTALHPEGVRVLPFTARYPEQSIARHLIGFVGENPERIRTMYANELAKGTMQPTDKIGVSGLEKSFDTYLQGVGKTTVSYFTDAEKRPLPGLDVRMVGPTNPFYPVQLVTTLDAAVQKEVEALLDKLGLKQGAVVVLDAANANVIAMASRPQFDPSNIQLNQGNWNNRALKALVPGSIFKTFIAAVALEEGLVRPDEEFDCTGELGKYGFSCWKEGGHGKLTFAEAYAESCNITFAKVMERIPSDMLERYAEKLGLGETVGWVSAEKGLRQFDAEEAGQIFARKTNAQDDGVRTQTSIGQRDVRMTPLQAANLVVTLLNEGEVLAPRVVKEMDYQNKRTYLRFDPQIWTDKQESISASTAKQILGWMQDVVTAGTGQYLKDADWQLAGKTGTAEIAGEGVSKRVNQWFIGYGPVESPRYTFAVVAENMPASAANLSLPITKGIADLLANQAF